MSLIIVLVILFFYIVYQNMAKKNRPKKKKTFKDFRKWIVLAGIILIPIAIANTYFGDYENLREEKHKENVDRFAYDFYKRSYYEYLFNEHKDSVELRFDFIDEIFKYQKFSCWAFLEEDYGGSERIEYLSETYGITKRFFDGLNTCKYDINDWEFDTSHQKYNYYFLGLKEVLNNDLESAEEYFLTEQEYFPNNYKNNEYLIQFYLWHFPEKLSEHIEKPNSLEGVNPSLRRAVLFESGKWDLYIKELFLRSFLDFDELAVLAALIITMLWVFFLQRLDIYNPEKWRDLIIVFILGCLFTNLCLIYYDFAHSFGFYIGESVTKDIVYNVFVIGFSEEIVKLIPWLLFALFSKKLKEPYDYILYASVAALGFAFIENWMYLQDPWNITIRTVMTVTMHMFAASVFAYSLVLYRFKYSNKKWKFLLPIAGFLGAAIAHGFFDLWLISPFLNEYSYVTRYAFIIFFHVWFYLINNSMNNSPFFNSRVLDRKFQTDIIIFGFTVVLIVEYLITSYEFGVENGNSLLIDDAPILILFGLYIHALIKGIELRKTRWRKYRLSIFEKLGSHILPNDTSNKRKEDYVGLELKLFVKKDNRHVSNLFPISGICEQEISIDGSPKWMLFKFNRSLNYINHNNDYALIKVKDDQTSLSQDKVEILLLFVPNNINVFKSNLRSKELSYTGPAFSRPAN